MHIKVILYGDVHGVFCRQGIKENAEILGLKGYARNVYRDKVEVLVEGHEAKIKKFIELVKKGPPGAEVKELKATKLPYTGEFNQFTIRH